MMSFFLFNDTATTEIYTYGHTRSLHDARPISGASKGLVGRKVVCIVPPGTVTDEALLSERRDTLLLAVARGKNGYGLAWADLAGGRFLVNEVSGDDALEAELARLDPAELLLPDEDGWPPFVAARGGARRRAPWLRSE